MRTLKEHAGASDNGLSGRQQVASRALNAIATPPVLSSLLGEFQCGDRIRQSKATRALVACGRPAAEALTDLLANAESLALRMRAVSALRAMGAEAIPVLVERLEGDEPWYVKRNAIAILRDVGCPQEVVALIARQARHPHIRVRLEAISALGNLGGPDAIAALMAGLDDREAVVREQAAIGLGKLRVAEAMPRLAKLIGRRLLASAENDDAVQCAACTALGQIGDERAIAPLLACLHRGWIVSGYHVKSDAVRCSAAQAVASFPTQLVRKELIAATRDGSVTVRAAADAALRRLDSEFSPAD
jgi:HEAT repeat protein